MKKDKKWNRIFDTKAMLILGVLAKVTLVAVLTFGMVLTGCAVDGSDDTTSPPVDAPTLPGTITISPNSGVTTGTRLTVTYRGGTETVRYQWSKNGTAISGATSRTYRPSVAGSYNVTVSATGYQSKTGTAFSVSEDPLSDLPGTITISPPTTAAIGTELSAAYSSTETASYQWQLDGTDIPGGTGRAYTPLTPGSYTVTVSAADYESKTSDAVTVTGPTGDSRETAIPLTADTFTNDSITAGGEKWYFFTAVVETNYIISWQDSGEQAPDSSYTAAVAVTAYSGDSTTALSDFSEVDNGYITPKSISGQSGTIYVKVAGDSSTTSGTFAIKYTYTYTPLAPDPRTRAFPLTAGNWVNSSIAVNGERWYSFTATPGSAHNVIWQDAKDYFAGLRYTAEITVTAYAGSTTPLDNVFLTHEYNTHTLTIPSGQSGTIYVKVAGYRSSSGNFAIKML